MSSRWTIWVSVALALSALCAGAACPAGTITNAVILDANQLVTTQTGNGSWPAEADFTGPIVAGLLDAYTLTGNVSYKTAAQNGAAFIMNSNSSLLGDEAYALMRTSAVQSNPVVNSYRTAVATYFTNVSAAPGGTNTTINNLVAHYTNAMNDQSEAVIYLSYYAVAAQMAGASDAMLWRNGLINTLAQVDDADQLPVESLGAAVWALAQTGNGLDSTMLTGPSAIFNNQTLADLPAILLNQIMPAGPGAGSFYYNFGHLDGGYTEDTAMGLMGLIAANQANPSLNLSSTILTSQLTLTDAIDSNGQTYMDVFQSSPDYHIFAGRALEGLQSPSIAAVPVPASFKMGSTVLCALMLTRWLARFPAGNRKGVFQ